MNKIGTDACSVNRDVLGKMNWIKIQLFYYDRVWKCKESAIAIGS